VLDAIVGESVIQIEKERRKKRLDFGFELCVGD
jgi:hypothetical protein